MDNKSRDPNPESAEVLEAIHEKMMAADDAAEDVERLDDVAEEAGELFRARNMLELIERARRDRQAGVRETVPGALVETDHPELFSAIFSELEKGCLETSSDEDTIRIDRFEIIRQLGQGGYGLVFLARDPQLDRLVALKIPRPEAVMTDELVDRFMREARAAAALSHPNIVPVFETGRTGPICFIASEYIEGLTLAESLKTEKISRDPHQTAETMATLAEAVAHAHQRGVLHRDLKPGNVLLKKGSATILPMITDFGLAKILDDSSFQTQTDAIVGTPAYMSPEQAGGARDKIGPSTDVYSLGAIMYELLTGTVPFAGESILETLTAVQQREPKPPRRIDGSISIDLEAICLKCLEKNPAQRYASAMDLYRDLIRYLNGETISARPVTQVQRLAKWCKRNPVIAGLSTAATLFLIAALAASLIGWFSTSNALEQSRESQRVAEQRYLQNKATVDKYFTQVSEDRLLKSPGLKPLRQELLKNALAFYTQFVLENSDDKTLAADLEDAHRRIGDIQSEMGQFQESLTSYQNALDWLQEQQDDSKQTMLRQASHLTKIADTEKLAGDPKQALTTIDLAIKILLDLAKTNTDDAIPRQTAFSYSVKAAIVESLGDTKNTEKLLNQAIDTLTAVADESTADTRTRNRLATWRGSLARILLSEGKIDEAEILEQKVTVQMREMIKENPDSLSDLDALARSLGEQGKMKLMMRKPQEAFVFLEESTRIFERLCLIHPQVFDYQRGYAASCSNTAVCLDLTNKLEEAEAFFRKSVGINEQLVKTDPDSSTPKQSLATEQMNLATCLAKQKKYEQAIEQFQLALPVLTALHERTPNDLNTRIRIGIIHMNLGKLSDDLEHFETALDASLRAVSTFTQLFKDFPNHPQMPIFLIRSHENQANILDHLDRSHDAIPHWQAALKIDKGRRKAEFELKKARSLLWAKNHTDALPIIAEFGPQLSAGKKQNFLLTQLYALSATAVANDETFADRIEVAENHQQNAIRALTQALNSGELKKPKNIKLLQASSDFDSLRDHREFQQIIDKLK